MKYLVVVDMQNDFITGSLGTKEAVEISELVKSFVHKFMDKSYDQGCVDPVFLKNCIFTMDTHFENYLDTLEGKHLPIKHCIEDTNGWALLDDIITDEHYGHILEKYTFGSWRLPCLIGNDADEIILCGLCTDICVIANVIILKTYFPDVEITVLEDLCAGTTPEMHRKALDVMQSLQINIKESEDVNFENIKGN